MLSGAKKLTEAKSYKESNEKLNALLKEDLKQYASIKEEETKLIEMINKEIRKLQLIKRKTASTQGCCRATIP